MLDVSLDQISVCRRRDGTRLAGSHRFAAGTHTGLCGPSGAGKSTLLHVIAGEVRPDSGVVRLGRQEVTPVPAKQRPVLLTSRDLAMPSRWTARHVLIAALRRTGLDRQDRLETFDRISTEWNLIPSLDVRLRHLSRGERTRVSLAQIEILRPAVLLAERLFEALPGFEARVLGSRLHETMRATGTTVIAEPAHGEEIELFDQLVMMDSGRMVQCGLPHEVIEAPVSIEAALAGGPANLIPVRISDSTVDSPIGSWSVDSPPFQGGGTAIVRPHHFDAASPREESDFIIAVERAAFREGIWHVEGFVTGGLLLRVAISPRISIHKGKLLSLRYDARRFVLLGVGAGYSATVSGDFMPSSHETR